MKRLPIYFIVLVIIGLVAYVTHGIPEGGREAAEVEQPGKQEPAAPPSLLGNAASSTAQELSRVLVAASAVSASAAPAAKAPYWKDALAEGFAVYFGKAIQASDARLAMGAYRLLQSCEGIDGEAAALQERLQSTPSTSPDYQFFLSELTSRQAEQCQSLSPEMRGSARSLLERAARGGVEGAASSYLRTFTPPVPLAEGDVWLVPLLTSDANKGDLASIYDLACDPRRQTVTEDKRQLYLAALRWAATNSPDAQRAQRWLQGCAFGGSAASDIQIPRELQGSIVKAAQQRLTGEK